MKRIDCSPKCVEKNKPEKSMTWEEMIRSEGVYRESMLVSDSRFVVVKNPPTLYTSVLYVSVAFVEPAEESWKAHRFIRTNEKFCCGFIKE